MQIFITNAKHSIKLFVRLPNGNGSELYVNPIITFQRLATLIQSTSLQLPH